MALCAPKTLSQMVRSVLFGKLPVIFPSTPTHTGPGKKDIPQQPGHAPAEFQRPEWGPNICVALLKINLLFICSLLHLALTESIAAAPRPRPLSQRPRLRARFA